MENKFNLIERLGLCNKLLNEVNSGQESDWLQSEIAKVTSLIFFFYNSEKTKGGIMK